MEGSKITHVVTITAEKIKPIVAFINISVAFQYTDFSLQLTDLLCCGAMGEASDVYLYYSPGNL